jgi:tetratricopeptide (TPR) repeat protein
MLYTTLPLCHNSPEQAKHRKKDIMSTIRGKIAAGISLFLFGSASFLFAQNTVPSPAQARPEAAAARGPAQSSEKGSAAASAASKTPDHARAYYHYMLARRFKELAGVQNRSDFADRAISEYKQAIEADPDSLFLRVELAGLYSRISRIADAVKEAEDVLKINPNHLDAHRLLAEIYLRNLGQNQAETNAKQSLQKAITHLEAVTHIDPTDTQSFVMLGRLYRMDNQTAKAEETFKKILDTDPGSHSAILSLAQVYSDQGDYAQAIDLIKKVPENDLNSDPTLLALLAYDYGQNHDFKDAVATYQKALDQDADNQDLRRAYAEALVSDGKTAEARAVLGKILKAEPDDGATYLRLGRLDRQEGNFDQARQELEHAKSLMRDNLEVPYELVLLEDALGNDDKAVLILQDILKQSEKPNGQYTASEGNNRAVFIERLGLIYRSQEKYDLALGAFKQMLALGKSQAPRGEGLIVETLRLNRQPQKALEEAELALKQYPMERPLQMLKASLIGEQGHVDEALRQLKGLLNNTPADDEIYRAIAQINSQARRFPDAEAAAEKALSASSKPEDQEFGHFLLGSIYERQKKYDLAEGEFKKVLNADPTSAQAANYLGYMLAERGIRLDESVKYIQKALQLEPNNGAYLDSLGWAYFKMNRYDLAEPPLEKAARLVANDPTIHEHLGHLYLQMGKRRQAEEQWERALKAWPNAVGSDFDAEQAGRLKKQLDDLRQFNNR